MSRVSFWLFFVVDFGKFFRFLGVWEKGRKREIEGR